MPLFSTLLISSLSIGCSGSDDESDGASGGGAIPDGLGLAAFAGSGDEDLESAAMTATNLHAYYAVSMAGSVGWTSGFGSFDIEASGVTGTPDDTFTLTGEDVFAFQPYGPSDCLQYTIDGVPGEAC